jgi:hypothetical protein
MGDPKSRVRHTITNTGVIVFLWLTKVVLSGQNRNNEENLRIAFKAAEKVGVEPLLDAEDIAITPEKLSIVTYVSTYVLLTQTNEVFWLSSVLLFSNNVALIVSIALLDLLRHLVALLAWTSRWLDCSAMRTACQTLRSRTTSTLLP